jgi:hypothetical protein
LTCPLSLYLGTEQVVEEERQRSGDAPSPFLGFLAGHHRPTDGLGVGVTIDPGLQLTCPFIGAPSTTTPAISSSFMPLTFASFASFASFARFSSPARHGFAPRTPSSPRVKKAITTLSWGHTGWRASGVAGVSGLSEPGYNGSRWRVGTQLGGDKEPGDKDQSLYLHAFDLGVLGASLFPRPEMCSRQGRKERQGFARQSTCPLVFTLVFSSPLMPYPAEQREDHSPVPLSLSSQICCCTYHNNQLISLEP